jgi:hypothetical protein
MTGEGAGWGLFGRIPEFTSRAVIVLLEAPPEQAARSYPRLF